MPNVGIDESNLRKPYFGSQQWGPVYKNIDIADEEDSSRLYLDQQFSSFEHMHREDCPSWTDPTVERGKKPHFNNGRAFYSCSSGSCLKGCPCIPCTNQDMYQELNSFKCPDHNPDHPEMFDKDEHLAISRRKFFHHNSKQPIFDRPRAHKDLCPPKVKLAGMMKKCK